MAVYMAGGGLFHHEREKERKRDREKESDPCVMRMDWDWTPNRGTHLMVT